MTRAHTLGFPRIGAKRELKFALESYWRGETTQAELIATGKSLRDRHWQAQRTAGVNLLPVGERMRYTASATAYTMSYRTPVAGSRLYTDWFGTRLFVWMPDLRRLAETRLTIDRQSAELRGELLNADGDTLGQLRMQCEPRQADDLPEPKF